MYEYLENRYKILASKQASKQASIMLYSISDGHLPGRSKSRVWLERKASVRHGLFLCLQMRMNIMENNKSRKDK